MVRTRASICARKRRYASAEAAMAAAREAGLVLRPYRCDRCARVHLTSRTKGKWVPLEPAVMLEPSEDDGRAAED